MTTDEWSDFCLAANALIWVSAFIIYQYRTRHFGVGSGILLLYAVISVLAIDLYHSELSYMFEKLALFPFIYLFLMILLASSPILTLEEKQIKRIKAPDIRLFNIVCIAIIIFAICRMPRTIMAIRENLMQILLDETAGAELYHEWSYTSVNKSETNFDIMSMASGIAGAVSLPFFIYYMTYAQKRKVLLALLVVASLQDPLYAISSGSRFGAAVYLFNICFLFLFTRNLFPAHARRKLNRMIVVIGIIFLVPFLAVTYSKAKGDTGKTLLSIERYSAEGFLLFNNYGLDAGGTREGDYTAVAFKYVAGLHPAMYYGGRLNKYHDMKLNESRFYTFVGDFTLDYGPVWAVVIFAATALFFKKCLKVRNGTITFHQYLMFYLLMHGCLGYFQFPLGREGGNLKMIGILFFAFLFKFAYDFNLRKKGFQR